MIVLINTINIVLNWFEIIGLKLINYFHALLFMTQFFRRSSLNFLKRNSFNESFLMWKVEMFCWHRFSTLKFLTWKFLSYSWSQSYLKVLLCGLGLFNLAFTLRKIICGFMEHFYISLWVSHAGKIVFLSYFLSYFFCYFWTHFVPGILIPIFMVISRFSRDIFLDLSSRFGYSFSDFLAFLETFFRHILIISRHFLKFSSLRLCHFFIFQLLLN